MAIIAVLAGSVLGVLFSILALVTLDLGWLAGLGIWWGTSVAITAMLLFAHVSPKGNQAVGLANEQA